MIPGEHQPFLDAAVALASTNITTGSGGPFGAVIVHRGEIIAQGTNQVIATNDPTAHAEILAIRNAAGRLKSPHLRDCVLYTSCEPCPMCLAAAWWARLPVIFHALSRDQAAAMGFDDAVFYQQLTLPPASRTIPIIHVALDSAADLVTRWNASPLRQIY